MTNNPSIGVWIRDSARLLIHITDTPQLEAQVLAAHVLDQNRSWLLAHQDLFLKQDQISRLNALLVERLDQVPLPYLIGGWSFYGLDFKVTPDVLIPRPETELLVSEALNWVKDHPPKHAIVDVGTGSACIAVSLAVNYPSLKVICTDISFQALKIARYNASRHQVYNQLAFIQTDLLPAFKGHFELICANLPYIPTATLATLPVRLFEPMTALDGGQDGLNFIRRLLVQSLFHILPGGLMLFEIEAGQADSALQLALESYPQSRCQIIADLAGLPRLLRIEVQ